MARLAQDQRRPWTRLLGPPGPGLEDSPRPLGPLALGEGPLPPPPAGTDPPYRGQAPQGSLTRGYFLDRYV